jgi:hypothetical protein
MALYEAMSKAQLKPGYGRTLEKIRSDRSADHEPSVEAEGAAVTQEIPAPVETEAAVVTEETGVEERIERPQVSVRWRRRPRVVQINGGRIEFSVPYQLGIAILLGLIVVVLLAYRAGGQGSVAVKEVKTNNPVRDIGGNRSNPPVTPNRAVRQEDAPVAKAPQDIANIVTATSTGSNVIVLVQHGSQRDLVPVQAHFASYGIATEIVNWGGRYYLITQDKYNSVAPGSDGYIAKQKIAQAGAEYKGKAPEGYETFAPHYFSDAYGKKIE